MRHASPCRFTSGSSADLTKFWMDWVPGHVEEPPSEPWRFHNIDSSSVLRIFLCLVQLRPSPTFKSSISPSGIRMDVPVISESRSDASFRNFTSWVSWADVAPPLVKSRACSNVSERCLNVDGAH
eukprot:XP_001177344.1 PREDICTED: uncharacterized protein LOC753887 [Strongylocentrotus purpuratus]